MLRIWMLGMEYCICGLDTQSNQIAHEYESEAYGLKRQKVLKNDQILHLDFLYFVFILMK